jgi:hypothetical protein
MSELLSSASTKCPPDFLERFKKMAKDDGRSVSSMILKLMKEAVARYEQSAG